MSNLPILGLREFTTAGAPLAGGKLYFYSAGTVNAKNTYSVEACTAGSENANPVVADANGRFGEIYLLGDEPYKVILKTSADVLVDEWDNVNATSLASSSVATRQKQIASNPLDWGALGDGVADESAEVQDAIDAATGTVDLLGKTFRCDSGLTLRSGITLCNGTLDFSNCDDTCIAVTGTVGTETLIAANVDPADMEVEVASASGFDIGKYALLAKSASDCEIVKVTDITGTTISVAQEVFQAYTTASADTLAPLEMATRVAMRDLVVLCNPASSSDYAVALTYCADCMLDNVRVVDAKIRSLSAVYCRDVIVRDCYAETDQTSGASIGINYCTLCTISGCTVSGGSTGFFLDGWHNVAERCTSHASSDGFTITGYHNRLRDCSAIDASGTPFNDQGTYTRIMAGAVTESSEFGAVHGIEASGVFGADKWGGYFEGSNGAKGVSSLGGGNGLTGHSQVAGNGVYGIGTGAASYGVHGSCALGVGVFGESASGRGVVAQGDTTSPARSAFAIVPQDAAPTGPNAVGDMYVSTAGKLYICTVAGTPGTWTLVGAQT